MRLLGFGQRLKPFGDFLEPFLARRTGHPRIHVSVFVGLARNGGTKVIRSATNRLAGRWISDLLKILKMAMGMAGLALGGRAEYSRDVVIAFDICLLCKIQIAPIGLALAGKRRLQIFLSSGTL